MGISPSRHMAVASRHLVEAEDPLLGRTRSEYLGIGLTQRRELVLMWICLL